MERHLIDVLRFAWSSGGLSRLRRVLPRRHPAGDRKVLEGMMGTMDAAFASSGSEAGGRAPPNCAPVPFVSLSITAEEGLRGQVKWRNSDRFDVTVPGAEAAPSGRP